MPTPLARLRSALVSADCRDHNRISVPTADLHAVLAMVPALDWSRECVRCGHKWLAGEATRCPECGA